MNYHPLTLSFNGPLAHLESGFREFRYRESLWRVRGALVVAFAFYAAFGILDAVLAPEKKLIFWGIRYGVFCPATLLILAFSWHHLFQRFEQALLFVLCLIAGVGIILMVTIADPPATYSYYAGIILVFIHIYTFLRMDFIWAAACTWLIVLCYEIGAIWIADTPTAILVNNNFFFISANLLCMLAGYSMELQERRSYYYNDRLNREKDKVAQANALLDQTVTERTKELVIANQQLKAEMSDRLVSENSRRALETELNRIQRMEAIGTLAGGIAHDFNNILSAVIGYTELTLDIVDKNSEANENLVAILRAALRARDLTRQILAFSRQTDQEIQPVRLDRLITEAIKLMRATLPATIEVQQSVRSISCVLGDPGQLHRIIINLCTNSAHAMGSQPGILSVNLEDIVVDESFIQPPEQLVPGEYVCLSISDTGCGMTPETMEKAFNPFFTTKPLDQGTGMGLSVVHGIVKACQGSLRVESLPGVGSTFFVYLPISKEAQELEYLEKNEHLQGSGHILVLDDEQAVAFSTQRSLESMGYTVTACLQPSKALALIEKAPEAIDLVITDYAMPKMTGLEVASRIKAISPNLPIILCTGYGENLSRENFEGTGIREFLVKPILRKTLGKAIAGILNPGQIIEP
ncbi:MAG: response regulator [Proteobacteria bacterium]|nr:response regulator [Pseudomonadota bacterium]